MLKIDTEFRKGIFFIRLKGSLTKETIDILDDQITNLVKENGIKNIVFNISDLISIDLKGINGLLYNYELCINNKGRVLICGLNNEDVAKKIRKSRLLNYIEDISNELNAFNLIEI